MAYCRNHPERIAANTCHQCGDWLCEECTVEINGRIFCRTCLAKLAGTPSRPSASSASGPSSAPPPAASFVHFRTPAPRGRYISGGMLAILSVFLPVPGVNYMYEGLIKRGLAAMGGFFFIIYALAAFSFWPFTFIFGISIPIYWLACLFDSINIRRRINAGEVVEDNIDDLITFVKSHKRLIITVVAALVVMSAAGSIVSVLAYPLRKMLPLIVVGFGVYVLFGRPRRRSGGKPEDKNINEQ